jgi:hypothetical protein
MSRMRLQFRTDQADLAAPHSKTGIAQQAQTIGRDGRMKKID